MNIGMIPIPEDSLLTKDSIFYNCVLLDIKIIKYPPINLKPFIMTY